MRPSSAPRRFPTFSIPPRWRAIALVAATATATAAVVLPAATAQSPAPAPQMVVGLPDFTNLVDQVGPGVVNVVSQIRGGRQQAAAQQVGQEVAEPVARARGH